MTHIVIYEDNDGITRYGQFEEIAGAASHLEDLHNREGISGARLFAMKEIEFAVTSYVKVEIGSAAEPAAKQSDPFAEFADTAAEVDSIEYVEAAMSSVDAFAPSGSPSEELEDKTRNGQAGRGLFGR